MIFARTMDDDSDVFSVDMFNEHDYSYPLPHWNMPNPAQMTNNFNSMAESNGPFMNHLHGEPIYTLLFL